MVCQDMGRNSQIRDSNNTVSVLGSTPSANKLSIVTSAYNFAADNSNKPLFASQSLPTVIALEGTTTSSRCHVNSHPDFQPIDERW